MQKLGADLNEAHKDKSDISVHARLLEQQLQDLKEDAQRRNDLTAAQQEIRYWRFGLAGNIRWRKIKNPLFGTKIERHRRI